MTKILWDQSGQKFFETGVTHAVLYPAAAAGGYDKGVAWNGITGVTESPTGAEPTPLYADNIKYLNLISLEELEASIEAYTYPDEFSECDGSAEILPGMIAGQQSRKEFGLCYRTVIGNDLNPNLGFKLHILYGALASPSERSYETVNDSPEAITFSWDVTTTPVQIEGYKPTSLLTFDSTKLAADKMALLLDKLYGTDDTEPELLLPNDIITLLSDPEPDPDPIEG